MSLFSEVMNPGTGRNNDALPLKFIKVGAAVVGLLVAAVIFFNYVASVTRIGAGYVGLEIVLSGSQRGPSEIPIPTGWVFGLVGERRPADGIAEAAIAVCAGGLLKSAASALVQPENKVAALRL